MATKKAAVAGSVQGPAVADPAMIAAATNTPAPAVVVPEPFPRKVVVVNDTPMHHIVGGALVAPSSQASLEVRDQDQITRLETDCKHLMELTPAYSGLEVQPLRVVDAAAE